jgi:hypothetical protein
MVLFRAVQCLLAILLCQAIHPCTAQIYPGGVTGNWLWLRPDAGTSTTTDGIPLSAWNDQSPIGNNAMQPTSIDQPLYENDAVNNIDFNPVIMFNGVSDVLYLN